MILRRIFLYSLVPVIFTILLAGCTRKSPIQINPNRSAKATPAKPIQIKAKPVKPTSLWIGKLLPLPDGQHVVIWAKKYDPLDPFHQTIKRPFKLSGILYSLNLETHNMSLIAEDGLTNLTDWVEGGKDVIALFNRNPDDYKSGFGPSLVELATGKIQPIIKSTAVEYVNDYFLLNPQRTLIASRRTNYARGWERYAKAHGSLETVWSDFSTWIINLPGGESRLLGNRMVPLGWSSDGKWVYIVQEDHSITSNAKEKGWSSWDVSGKNIANNEIRRLTETSDIISWQPIWTQQRALFCRKELANPRFPAYISVWMMPELGGKPELILKEEEAEDRFLKDLVSSPDGKVAAFGGKHMWLLNLQSHKITRMTKDEWAWWLPAWLPDGKRLIFCRIGEPNSIWIADRDKPLSAKQIWPPK